MSLYKVVFVLGPPGSGKGTQCARISSELGWKHLSAGDLLRAEQARPGSEFGALIDGHIREGTIVPVEITCALLENAMKGEQGNVKGFLIDGFPRNKNNLEGWNREMGDKVDVKFVLFLECAEGVCEERILGRAEGRTDDNAEVLKKRRDTYLTQTMDIVKHYEAKGLVRKVDAGRGPDEVFGDVRKAFDKLS